MSDDNKDTPPGPPARWVTIRREYDKDDRLISETTTDTRETEVSNPERPIPGLYL